MFTVLTIEKKKKVLFKRCRLSLTSGAERACGPCIRTLARAAEPAWAAMGSGVALTA